MTPEERYNLAVETVLDDEKYWADDPDDAGGLTIWGVSTRSFPEDVERMKAMTEAESREYAKKEFYKREFWHKGGYDRIKWDDLAIKAFNLSVTTGPVAVNKALQRACNIIRNRWDNPIDGVLGPKSLSIINSMPPRTLYKIFIGEMDKYYRSLNKPKYENGWLARLNREVTVVNG